jgi:ABC-type uncharacterized transport system substrate-binding protein
MLLRLFLALLITCTASPAWADLVLLLSDNKPSISGVAQAIQHLYGGKIESYNLGGDRNRAGEIAAAIQNSGNQQVIAIGLLAAQTARRNLSSKQVVFCQVLNYEEADLVTPWMKGVSAIPSLAKQFKVWKMLDPRLKRIGVITSRNMRDTVSNAQAAATAAGLELIHSEVSSDREVMPALRQLTGRIQGLWLAPDSSILSSSVLRDIMSHTTRQNIQVLAFSPALLREGALLSGTPDATETAHLALSRIKQTQGAHDIPGDAVIPLSGADISVSAKSAERLGLSISDKLRENVNVE